MNKKDKIEKFAYVLNEAIRAANSQGSHFMYRVSWHRAMIKVSKLIPNLEVLLGDAMQKIEPIKPNSKLFVKASKTNRGALHYERFQKQLIIDFEKVERVKNLDFVEAWNLLKKESKDEKEYRQSINRLLRVFVFFWEYKGKPLKDVNLEKIQKTDLQTYYSLFQSRRNFFKRLISQKESGIIRNTFLKHEAFLNRLIAKQEIQIALEKVDPITATLRGVFAEDCASYGYPYYSFLRDVDIFLIHSRGIHSSKIIGYVFVVQASNQEKKVPYIMTLKSELFLPNSVIFDIFSIIAKVFNANEIYFPNLEIKDNLLLCHDYWIERIRNIFPIDKRVKLKPPCGWKTVCEFSKKNCKIYLIDPYRSLKTAFFAQRFALKSNFSIIEDDFQKNVIPPSKEMLKLIAARVEVELGAKYSQRILRKFNLHQEEICVELDLLKTDFDPKKYSEMGENKLVSPILSLSCAMSKLYFADPRIFNDISWLDIFRPITSELEFVYKKLSKKRYQRKFSILLVNALLPDSYRSEYLEEKSNKLIIRYFHKIFFVSNNFIHKAIRRYFLKSIFKQDWETYNLLAFYWDNSQGHSRVEVMDTY